jgi:YegS/Rv2252/BmrU family lipid kinase
LVKTRFIFNPRSGHNVGKPSPLELTRAFMREHAPQSELIFTERARHANELARQAVEDGCERVVAIGGDGTLNEVAAALVDTGAVLGLVPCGSGNGLGRHLGIPRPDQSAFDTLLHGRVRAIDTGTANGIPFFNVMGLGFDAEISHRFNQLARRGLSSYIKTTCGALLHYRTKTYHIRNETTSLITPAFIIAVANSDQYGNNCIIAPGARLDDGLLDLTVIRRVSFLNALPLIGRLFAGRLGGGKNISRLQGAHFTIGRAAPGLIHTDGEVHETGAIVEIAVRPQSLRVLVPAAAPSA